MSTLEKQELAIESQYQQSHSKKPSVPVNTMKLTWSLFIPKKKVIISPGNTKRKFSSFKEKLGLTKREHRSGPGYHLKMRNGYGRMEVRWITRTGNMKCLGIRVRQLSKRLLMTLGLLFQEIASKDSFARSSCGFQRSGGIWSWFKNLHFIDNHLDCRKTLISLSNKLKTGSLKTKVEDILRKRAYPKV